MYLASTYQSPITPHRSAVEQRHRKQLGCLLRIKNRCMATTHCASKLRFTVQEAASSSLSSTELQELTYQFLTACPQETST